MQFQEIEQRVQKLWTQKKAFWCDLDSDKASFYCLTMFPYPSGRIHMGHVRNYTIGDVVARAKRMSGYNVFFPIGWDAFGLPAENAALAHKVHPHQWTKENIDQMRSQLQRLGFSYDWDKELATCDSDYYKHEQWLFLKMFEKGLVYRKESEVNWDPVDKTVLANEQVIDGRGWRSGALVERKMIPQWFLKITDYAQELENELAHLVSWPSQVLVMQKNWIGISHGLEIDFAITPINTTVSVYTTRPDTLLGVTYLAISARHPLVDSLLDEQPDLTPHVERMLQGSAKEQELATMEKEGIDSGLKARHPLTGELIPIWIANYVLMDYGTGAVMAVPAHDERDYQFALKYGLSIKQVIKPAEQSESDSSLPYLEQGQGCCEPFMGVSCEEISTEVGHILEKRASGRWKTQVRLRDWGISRQRYWGAPIPICHCPSCGPQPVPFENLPVKLPLEVAVHEGESLKAYQDFIMTTCPVCKEPARRETDTFDTFMESSWYFTRFLNHDLEDKIVDFNRAKRWLPVNQYIGGIEHAILHLLYSRFMHKVMRDLGLVDCSEPFDSLYTQGMVLKDGCKMSKSKGNVVCPQEYIDKYGADTIRLYMMFQAPSDQSLEWSDHAVEGAHRYLKRVDTFIKQVKPQPLWPSHDFLQQQLSESQQQMRRTTYQTLEKICSDYDQRLSFNTAISSAMILTNALSAYKVSDKIDEAIVFEGAWILTLVLAPITPHLSQQHYEYLSGKDDLVMNQKWPTIDKEALKSQTQTLVVQVNGKKRGLISVGIDMSDEDIISLAKEEENVARFIAQSQLLKAFVVKNRLVNLVVGQKKGE